jgi:hypothetical protein
MSNRISLEHAEKMHQCGAPVDIGELLRDGHAWDDQRKSCRNTSNPMVDG